jgi:hypothetical protein
MPVDVYALSNRRNIGGDNHSSGDDTGSYGYDCSYLHRPLDIVSAAADVLTKHSNEIDVVKTLFY